MLLSAAHTLLLLTAITAATAYSTPRYPVGYDPDDRTRPSLRTARQHCACPSLPTPLPHDAGPRPDAQPWKPPVGYDPLKRRSPPRATHGSALHLSSLYRKQGVEEIAWDPTQRKHGDSDDGGKTTLCTGIWMGKKILFKTCVDIERESWSS